MRIVPHMITQFSNDSTYDSSLLYLRTSWNARFFENPVTHRQDDEGNILAFSFSLFRKLAYKTATWRIFGASSPIWLIDWFYFYGFCERKRERESEIEAVMGSEQEAGDLAHAIGDRNFHTRGFYFNGRLTAACLGARTHGGSRSHPSIHPSTASAFFCPSVSVQVNS